MKIRLPPLISALLVAVWTHAHELDVSWQIEGDRLTVQAVTDDVPAAGATVELRDASGRVVASGTLDGAGRFQWSLTPVAGDLVVVVNDGVGHRCTKTVPAANLQARTGSLNHTAPAEPAKDYAVHHPAHPAGHSDGPEPLAVRVVAGVAFLLAAGAAWLSYRNHRRLAELEQRLHR